MGRSRGSSRATCRSAWPGPPPRRAALEQRLASQEGAFDVHRYADEAAARQAIEDREVYGACVARPAGPRC